MSIVSDAETFAPIQENRLSSDFVGTSCSAIFAALGAKRSINTSCLVSGS